MHPSSWNLAISVKIAASAASTRLAVTVLTVSAAGAAELPSRLFPQVEKASFTDDQQPRWLHGRLGQLEDGDIKAATRNYIDDRRQQFSLTTTDEIEIVKSSSDPSGMTHIRLQQTHFDLPVEGADAWLHVSHDGSVETFNGYLAGKEICADRDAAAGRASGEQALARALLKLLGAERPIWPSGVLAIGALTPTEALSSL